MLTVNEAEDCLTFEIDDEHECVQISASVLLAELTNASSNCWASIA